MHPSSKCNSCFYPVYKTPPFFSDDRSRQNFRPTEECEDFDGKYLLFEKQVALLQQARDNDRKITDPAMILCFKCQKE